ncbi:NAD(P)-binding protein [Lindgomyces ingoldianus]|uniref:NAD(P)-binding protein n=1 Tax=Lindgomyces ingoldianus TaxID=673940 RepID=A0ACB6R266_9PLEO|nr:NAD(P)-binding protein [Lindgomyces ingoldianus]KAF2472602.1 NAD(P)-binding protein [Lindgomyces ingoldianus]
MLKSVFSQWYPPAATFTEEDVLDQSGKVFIITGANQGIGFELTKSLYKTGATIYMAGRSADHMAASISKIRSSNPAPVTPSTLKFLHLDLADLASVKSAAAEFSRQETKVNILWNNAAIGGAPNGTATAQNLEAHVGTNCVAPLLFTQLLLPQLRNAAQSAPEGSVRVIWSGSAMVDTHSVLGGLNFKSIEEPQTTDSNTDYAASKVGNWFLAVEAAKAWSPYGIVSVVQNPGNLDTKAYRYQSWFLVTLLKWLVLYPPKYGAYTLLFSGFSMEVKSGDFIWPWGRVARSPREDIHEAIRKGASERFWTWCEEKAKLHD